MYVKHYSRYLKTHGYRNLKEPEIKAFSINQLEKTYLPKIALDKQTHMFH